MGILKIGQVAAAANVNRETIKYYEKRELIPMPVRSDSGYRLYQESTIEDIRLIKRAQEIGFTLNEIKQLLLLIKEENSLPMEEMQTFAASKIVEIDEKISKLADFKTLLQQAMAREVISDPFFKEDCPVLRKIGKGDAFEHDD